MSGPRPPVPFKDHCSIIHNGVLYVYSPDAFQTLELKEGAEWKEEPNGISVTGAVCTKGGIDGDNSRPALYVVGGAANQSSPDYPGLQRFSIDDKSWTTIKPEVAVTQQRRNHGSAYMTSSSSLIVYGGSQDGDEGPSTQTFVVETYPPYRVLAYNSNNAPPTTRPFMLPWSDERALMVGGGDTNTNIFTFSQDEGWVDLGLAMPDALPDHSLAGCALFTLRDNSKLLQTFQLGQAPPTVTTTVLLNPGNTPATFNQTVGNSDPPSSDEAPASKKSRRATFLSNYPVYNGSLAPSETRTGFDVAQGDDGLLAFVGGNDNDPVAFFNQSDNTWVSNTQILGVQQSVASPSGTATSRNPSATASSDPSQNTAVPPASSSSRSKGLTILGAVLGGVCGLAAILIILLLWLRSKRRKRAQAARQDDYPDDKKRSGEYNYEEGGLQPLSKAGQPMGRSPVPSAVISDADSTAMFGAKPDPKYLIRRVSADRNQPGFRGSGIAFGQALFKREKAQQLSISKPMNPVLGDYKERPSIDLGMATPAVAPSIIPPAPKSAPIRKASQRKTDEGWGKYFQKETQPSNRATFLSRSSASKSGFWPGTGVPEPTTKTQKIILRDSVGNPLEAHTVPAGSPSLEHGPSNARSRGLQSVQGMPARISSGSSMTTNSDDSEYEEDRIDGAFSSGIPASVRNTSWTPVGNTWSGPAERPLHPPSSYLAAQGQGPPPRTASSGDTFDTQTSSIPSFPMPRSVRSPPPTNNSTTGGGRGYQKNDQGPGDYFGGGVGRSDKPGSNDMSWLNLGTPR
ncbi:hypothetical protein B0A52_02234 [Exophiala mesophila]|uniref:Pre-mRNA splicing factor CLF1 n=1 Tax=Exophiala mesophila TaxID=212818 RepID=A0A438NBW8_EXOME|nr:hypothetical protein B0A52_02234 [Exophiala mesophila]